MTTAAPKMVRRTIDISQFDWGNHHGDIVVTNTVTGGKKFFRVKYINEGGFAGKTILEVCEGDVRQFKDWKGFAFVNRVTAQGEPLDNPYVVVWTKLRGTGKDKPYEMYAKMLRNPDEFKAKGVSYECAVMVDESEPVSPPPAATTDGDDIPF
jgi:hypothetical protein